ncbi:unnamed protein product [Linum tenue]|uniref:SWIM-type domain-containing protein n=1 Tax=Linum tenue TaxID=586396 RepID=A0AAV0HVK8_9ROSI|nr:unnamed protein product [Linum tenue]
MPRAKLILICQCGGEFTKHDDGTMSYSGGDAHAVEINRDTVFDDLKLRVAETCNLELQSVCMKYFIPGMTKTLITLSNDKDFNTMYEFYGESITADIYVTGTQGFVRATPTPSPKKRPAPASLGRVVKALPATTGMLKRAASKSKSKSNSRSRSRSKSAAADSPSSSKSSPSSDSDDSSPDTESAGIETPQSPTSKVVDVPITFDLAATPADTVKKRRRTASWKIGTNGRMTIGSSANEGDSRITASCIKTIRNLDPSVGGSGTELMVIDEHTRDGSLDQLVATWRDGITGMGQEFESVVKFRDALQKYAIAHRFGYKLKKNDSNRVSAVCAARACYWKIFASWVPNDEVLRIKKMDEPHTCGEDSWKSVHASKNWLVNVIKERLRESPHHKPKEISNGIFRDFGIEPNYAQVRRAIEQAREEMLGSYTEAYKKLPWYCERLQEANPGSSTNLVVDNESNKFQRLFISYRALVEGFQNGCRPVLYLDSTPLRSKHHEILLTASALDGDDGIFPVAYAIVDIENKDSWHWFLVQLRSAISSSEPITFVSDREKELRESMIEVFTGSYHRYSLYHLLEEFKRNLKGPFHGDGRPSLPVNMLAAACTRRLETFNMLLDRIKEVSIKAHEWLVQIDPELWASSHFKGEQYTPEKPDSFSTANFYSKWIDEVREMPITMKLEAIRGNIMELMQSRKTESDSWMTTLRITPSKEKKLQEEGARARSYKVLFSNGILFEVHDGLINVVDTDSRKCTCLEWVVNEFPCRHAIAVSLRTGHVAYDYCSQYFSVEKYRAAYSGSINPVTDPYSPPEEENDEEMTESTAVVLPPTTPRPPPLPRERYYKSRGELKRIILCTRCKGEGHNKATCKEPPSEEGDKEADGAQQPEEQHLLEELDQGEESTEKESSNLGEQKLKALCTRCKGEGHYEATCKEPLILTEEVNKDES